MTYCLKPTITVHHMGPFRCPECNYVMNNHIKTTWCVNEDCVNLGIEYALPTVILTRIKKVRT